MAHRAPMLLLDDIIAYDQQRLCAVIRVHPDKPFCDERGAPGWIGLEWMAQAAGAWVGAHQLDSGQSVKIGFLLGTRRYQGPPRFAPGLWHAIASVILFDEAAGIAVMDATLELPSTDDKPVASSRIKLFQPPDATDSLQSQSVTRI